MALLRNIIVLLATFCLCVAAVELGTPRLLFESSGRMIVSKPRGNAAVYMDAGGLVMDAGASNISGYFQFGPTNLVNLTMEAIVTPLKAYTGASLGDYPSNTYAHGGIGVRDVISSDFALLVMLTAENTNGVLGAGQIHIVDRSNNVEFPTKYNLPSVSYGTRYKLRLVNSLLTNLAVSVWNYDAGLLLTNFNYTIQPNMPTSGAPAFHVYGQKMLFNQVTVTESDGSRTWFAPQMMAQAYTANNQQGYYFSNGVLRVFSNGSSNSANSWNLANTQLRIGAVGTVRGKMRPISGRIHGISVGYSNAYGASLAWDDNSNGIRYYTNVAGGTPTVVTTFATGDLTLGTEYDWSLVKSNDVLTWTIDGDTVSITNTIYPGADYFGFLGFGSLVEHREVRLTP